LGPLLFLLYVNNLPGVIEGKATSILFAEDTSILITSLNTTKLQNDINIVLNKYIYI
jgi:hypothetical protein